MWAYWAKIDIIISIITKTTLILILRIIVITILRIIIIIIIITNKDTRYKRAGWAEFIRKRDIKVATKPRM